MSDILTRLFEYLISTGGLIVAGLVGWWLAHYFQSAKVFFDSKRVACEQLIAHFATMLAVATRWAQEKLEGRSGDQFMAQYNDLGERTWSLIGHLTLYSPPRIARRFIDFHNRLTSLMDQFKQGDARARAILLTQDPHWSEFREREIFRGINSARRSLILSTIIPWISW